MVYEWDCSGCGGGSGSPGESETSNTNPNENGNTGGGGGGTQGTSNGNSAGANPTDNVGISLTEAEIALSEIYDCVSNYGGLNPILGGYLSSQTDSRGHNPLALKIKKFIDDNGGCSAENNSFIEFSLEALMEGFHETTFEELLEILDFQEEYRNQMTTTELAVFDAQTKLTKFRYLQSAYNAKKMSEDLYPNSSNIPCNIRNGISNAFKHALWNALSTIRIGFDLTKQLTDAHEDISYLYPLHYKETEMDLFNNNKGRQLAMGSGLIWKLVKDALENGELRYLSNLDPNSTYPGGCNSTSSSKLIPTN